MSASVKSMLDVLCSYYADRDGTPYRLNQVQAAVYTQGLGQYDAKVLEKAARNWMNTSAFFPKVSDLRKLIDPPTDMTAAAHLAWTAVEQAIRCGGVYAGAKFLNGAVGETARQVFGSWLTACSFDLDSPGWAIRRQTFLQIFPSVMARGPIPAVTMLGIHGRNADPYVVGRIPGVPDVLSLESGEPDYELPATTQEASKLLSLVRKRAVDEGVITE